MCMFYTLSRLAPKCMRISRHKSLNTFLRYVQADSKEAQDEFVTAFSIVF